MQPKMYVGTGFKESDVKDVRNLQEKCFTDPEKSSPHDEVSLKRFADLCRKGRAHGTVVRDVRGNTIAFGLSGDKREMKHGRSYARPNSPAGTVRTIACLAVEPERQRQGLGSMLENRHAMLEMKSAPVLEHGGTLKIRAEHEGAEAAYHGLFGQDFKPGVTRSGHCAYQTKNGKPITPELMEKAEAGMAEAKRKHQTRITFSSKERFYLACRHPRYANYYLVKVLSGLKRTRRRAQRALGTTSDP